VSIAESRLSKIKYIAAYQTRPVLAITHYAPVERIEPYGGLGKYTVIFSDKPKTIGPIPFGDASSGSMQSPRSTTLAQLKMAKKLTALTRKA
jgi:hypothetical protein